MAKAFVARTRRAGGSFLFFEACFIGFFDASSAFLRGIISHYHTHTFTGYHHHLTCILIAYELYRHIIVVDALRSSKQQQYNSPRHFL